MPQSCSIVFKNSLVNIAKKLLLAILKLIERDLSRLNTNDIPGFIRLLDTMDGYIHHQDYKILSLSDLSESVRLNECLLKQLHHMKSVKIFTIQDNKDVTSLYDYLDQLKKRILMDKKNEQAFSKTNQTNSIKEVLSTEPTITFEAKDTPLSRLSLSRNWISERTLQPSQASQLRPASPR